VAAEVGISTTTGTQLSSLGLAAHPDQDPNCVGRAFKAGINYFFFYSPGSKLFIDSLKPLIAEHRDEIILASGSGSRTRSGLQAVRRKIAKVAGADMLDIFFAEYIHPGDNTASVFGRGGVLDELQKWKTDGLIRYVGASCHDRSLAKQLAEDPRVEILMHRFNMAHRKAANEVFPAAIKSKTPVVAFTATRWGTLLEGNAEWSGELPTAADCYRYCLAQSAVHVVLTAPKSLDELEQNAGVLKLPPMDAESLIHWDRFGDKVYERSGSTKDYETRWP
jgi:aryl-alcohol dehydrogenase-like predicted oxidoreductase